MNDTQLKTLISYVKSSPLLTKEDRDYWRVKMETMSDSQLTELNRILTEAKDVNWDEELEKQESAVEKAEKIADEALKNFQPSSK